MYSPDSSFLGGYTPRDGTIDFYGRIKAFAKPEHIVLDLGAGRAAWFEDDPCGYRRQIRTLKGHVREVIACDIDKIVMENRSSNRNILMGDTVPLPDNSVDIIVADYVLEHVQDPVGFASEVCRLLKPSGLFCARTPHKYSYVAIGARILPKYMHSDALKNLQPERKSKDIFPTAYKLNTINEIERHFSQFESLSYIFRANPAYFFGNQNVYGLLEALHQLTPAWFSGNIFAFMRALKP
jgi:SAM-dependent methyltransferase